MNTARMIGYGFSRERFTRKECNMKRHLKRYKKIYPVCAPTKCCVCGKMIQKELGYFDKDYQDYYHLMCMRKTET
jgi:hypothetical protein